MKGGFKLLETRSADDSINVTAIERELGLRLPPLYRLFLKTFVVGENKVKKEQYLLEGELYPCSSYVYKPKEYIGFSHFISPEMLVNIWNELDEDSYEKTNSFVPIGATGTSAIIFVGAASKNFDKIYLEYESDWTLVCNSVFEFVRGLEFWTRADDPTARQTIPFSKLYRTWSENFWRVRGDSQT